ncbi:MAG: hypothetical protein O9327_15065, partial [Polaromonas sp.]|nr:hypothetical protein [Polaromonas sp.]
MSELKTITGRLHFLGASTYDQQVRTYQAVEITTSGGRVDLGTTMIPMEADRAMEIGNEVSLLVIEGIGPQKGKHVVLAVYDKGQDRTFFNAEMARPKDAFKKQAVMVSWFSVIGIPLGLAMLVAPGLLVAYYLYVAWDAYNAMPENDVIKARIVELPKQFGQAGGGGVESA